MRASEALLPASPAGSTQRSARAGSPIPGRLQLLRSTNAPALRYYAWRHPAPAAGGPWLVAVHGISRDAREQIRLLQPEARRRGYSLAAPLFDDLRFAGYQQLGLGRNGQRADLALLGVLDDLRARSGAEPAVDLFGFSGGAQFAHRFALFHPGHIRRLAVAAAGWYTLPDASRKYPYGTAPRAGDHPRADLEGFLALPKLLLVGSRDTTRDPALRRRPALDREQGRHRLARAVNWYRLLDELAAARGTRARCTFRALQDVDHDFTRAVSLGGLDQHLFDFLCK